MIDYYNLFKDKTSSLVFSYVRLLSDGHQRILRQRTIAPDRLPQPQCAQREAFAPNVSLPVYTSDLVCETRGMMTDI